jgi:hypothetical protein
MDVRPMRLCNLSLTHFWLFPFVWPVFSFSTPLELSHCEMESLKAGGEASVGKPSHLFFWFLVVFGTLSLLLACYMAVFVLLHPIKI